MAYSYAMCSTDLAYGATSQRQDPFGVYARYQQGTSPRLSYAMSGTGPLPCPAYWHRPTLTLCGVPWTRTSLCVEAARCLVCFPIGLRMCYALSVLPCYGCAMLWVGYAMSDTDVAHAANTNRRRAHSSQHPPVPSLRSKPLTRSSPSKKKKMTSPSTFV